jgi:hypothetical protein
MKTIAIDECTKMIRAALKQGFPNTKFSVRKTRSTYTHNIDVSWTDGPTSGQVKPILDRYESQGFDGQTDCSYSCGKRILLGVEVEVCGNYVRGHRSISNDLRKIIVNKLAVECGTESEISFDQYGNIQYMDKIVPFQWFANWNPELITVQEFLDTRHILVSDATGGECFTSLVYRIENHISLEAQKPIAPELLPEYIDVNAEVSTGRTADEDKRKMFEGHAVLADGAWKAVADFEEAVTKTVPAEFGCSIGRSYPKPLGSCQFCGALWQNEKDREDCGGCEARTAAAYSVYVQ